MKKHILLLMFAFLLGGCNAGYPTVPPFYPSSNKTTTSNIESPSTSSTSQASSIWGKWVAMGTSITEDNIYMRDPKNTPVGTYIPYLSELMGVKAPDANYSVAGAAFAGHILMYIHDKNIQKYGLDIYGYSHIPLKEADLITIEGSINDFHSSVPLGKVGDTVPYAYFPPVEQDINSTNTYGGTREGTFAGCIYKTITKLREINPKAKIVFITDNTGKEECAADTKNSVGHTPNEYNDMMMEVATSMGCYAIDAGRTAGFEDNLDTYLRDHIHHTEAGGKAYAEAIYKGLCEIKENW